MNGRTRAAGRTEGARPSRLSNLQDRYDDHIRVATLDVTDALAARTAVQMATKAFGRLDVLVNNAGFGHVALFEQATEEDFRAQIDTNFYGVVNLTRAALPVMRRQRSGHIINISSVGGRIGVADLVPRGAAGAAMGVANGIGNLGGFAGPLVFGWLRSSSGDFSSSMIVGGVAFRG